MSLTAIYRPKNVACQVTMACVLAKDVLDCGCRSLAQTHRANPTLTLQLKTPFLSLAQLRQQAHPATTAHSRHKISKLLGTSHEQGRKFKAPSFNRIRICASSCFLYNTIFNETEPLQPRIPNATDPHHPRPAHPHPTPALSRHTREFQQQEARLDCLPNLECLNDVLQAA